jgi:hypothetical protein
MKDQPGTSISLFRCEMNLLFDDYDIANKIVDGLLCEASQRGHVECNLERAIIFLFVRAYVPRLGGLYA